MPEKTTEKDYKLAFADIYNTIDAIISRVEADVPVLIFDELREVLDKHRSLNQNFFMTMLIEHPAPPSEDV